MVDLRTVSAYFLSHASTDKDFVKAVATRVLLSGRRAFLDEWSIGYGESIPGAISTALRDYDGIVLFWSENALKSAWVKREFNSAISRSIDDPTRALLLVRLDETEPPELVRDLKWIDARTGDPDQVSDAILGFAGQDRFIAMQKHLASLKMNMRYFEGYGVAVACPRCGASYTLLEPYFEPEGDGEHDHVGVRCTECDWHQSQMIGGK